MATAKSKKDILQIDNPRSMYSLSPKEVRRELRKIPIAILALPEEELVRTVRPNPTMRILKLRFWDEYRRVQEQNEGPDPDGIDITRVCESILNPAFFVQKMMSSYHVSSWLLLPPKSYEVAMEETLAMGVQRIREIFEIPIRIEKHERDEEGNIISTKVEYDLKAANLILRAYNQVESRMKGGIVQRHQIAASTVTHQEFREVREAKSVEEIEARLKELESSDNSAAIDIKTSPIKEKF